MQLSILIAHISNPVQPYRDYSGRIAALLLDEGANINENTNSVLSTPLHLAVQKHNVQTATVLIQRGCDVNLQVCTSFKAASDFW